MPNDFDEFFESSFGVLLSEEALSLPFKKKDDGSEVQFKGVPIGGNKNKSEGSDLIHPDQTDHPPVEGNSDIIAKRNRRLRSKCRNWQLFDTKKKVWLNPNTRYTRRRDADEEIKKMNPPA